MLEPEISIFRNIRNSFGSGFFFFPSLDLYKVHKIVAHYSISFIFGGSSQGNEMQKPEYLENGNTCY